MLEEYVVCKFVKWENFHLEHISIVLPKLNPATLYNSVITARCKYCKSLYVVSR